MKENISVREAINTGHKYVTMPFFMFFLTGILISIYLVVSSKISLILLIISIIFLVIVIPWLYWSFTINIWRNWAFENVRNVHELKNKAIDSSLIYSDGSIFNKTIITFPSQKNKWNSLQEKFKQNDIVEIEIFNDDSTIESEIKIYISKNKSILYIFCSLILFLVGIGKFIKGDDNVWATIITIIGVIAIYFSIKQILNNNPQIILNNNGIETVDTHFYEWKQIKNECVVVEKSARRYNYYLKYDYPKGSEKVDLNDLKIEPEYLKKLLKTYKGRYNNKNYR